MARRRYLSTEISKDARIARLATEYGDFAALLYTWMIPHAEDDCGLPSDHDEIMLLVIPGLRKKKRADVDKAIAGMLELELLMIEPGGRYFFPPDAFYKYQSYVKADNRRSTAENAEKLRSTAENAVSVTPSPSVPISVPIRSASDGDLDRVAGAFASFGKVTSGTSDAISYSVKDFGLEWVEKAVRTAAGASFDDRPPWGYVESILERWKQQGEPDDERVQEPRRPSGRTGRIDASERAAARIGT